jgi:hypothetical protein
VISCIKVNVGGSLMDFGIFIMVGGVVTLLLLLTTVLIGLRIIKASFKVHKIFGITTLCIAFFHGVLAILHYVIGVL